MGFIELFSPFCRTWLKPASRCGLGMQHCDCSGCIDYRRVHGRSQRSHVVGPWALHMGQGPARRGSDGFWEVGRCWNMLDPKFRVIGDIAQDHVGHCKDTLFTKNHTYAYCVVLHVPFSWYVERSQNVSTYPVGQWSDLLTFQPWQDGISLFDLIVFIVVSRSLPLGLSSFYMSQWLQLATLCFFFYLQGLGTNWTC